MPKTRRTAAVAAPIWSAASRAAASPANTGFYECVIVSLAGMAFALMLIAHHAILDAAQLAMAAG